MGERVAAGHPRRVADIAGGVTAALLAFTAVPAVLVLVVGNPLAGGVGHTWQPLPRDALGALALAAWVAWAACCTQLVRGVVVRVRSGDARTVGGASVVDRVAARIAIGVLALTSIGAPLALSSGAGASTTAAPTQVVGLGSDDGTPLGAPTSGGGQTPAADPAVSAPQAAHVVRAGETLWSIAADRLEDGAAWTDLAALNLGRTMADGSRFVDPDHVVAGWRLRLPAGARAGAGRDAARLPAGRTGARAQGGDDTHRLPELVALGLGSLACAALARRAGRWRRGDRFTGTLDVGATPERVDALALVGRFDRVPALAAFEVANGFLGRTLADEPVGSPGRPRVRAISVAPTGVTFWLSESGRAAPDGFESVAGGSGWRVDHETLGGQHPGPPYVPLALPVGDDVDGTWLVCLDRGDILPVLGEGAPSLCRAARSAADGWAWSDALVVVDDADDPRLHAELAADPAVARAVLVFGDPSALAPTDATRVAVVTTASVPATDVTVFVDRHGASLHPLGRVVRPHLQPEETAHALAALRPSALDGSGVIVGLEPTAPPTSGPAPGDEPSDNAPGVVEVRLLAMSPRLDGLCEELPPNRARRAVELVAYLALHQPDVITSDRLRTRVLGSADADAASKTLFNTAHAARRAMGVDRRGVPLFPAATRNGHYQVSAEVTVDVRRAIALTAAGRAHEDDDVDAALASYRAALSLVEGEPLANALSGYSWWEAEGHGGRIAAALVEAAVAMAELAVARGRFGLARWGLEQARLVEPYSEALSRAAMEVAAAEGDGDRLRLEWRECQRRIDALDPGSSPSARTERLYGELSRRVAVGMEEGAGGRADYAPAAGDRA